MRAATAETRPLMGAAIINQPQVGILRMGEIVKRGGAAGRRAGCDTLLLLAGCATPRARGALVCGGGSIAAALVGEAFFHAPENPGPGYASEVRTDLLTKIVPTLAFLLADAIWGDASQ